MLLLSRRSAVEVRSVALVHLRSVVVARPQPPTTASTARDKADRRCSRFRRSGSRTPDELAILLVLRSLARRIEAATAEADELEVILKHVRALVPELLDAPGAAHRRRATDRHLVAQRSRPLRGRLRSPPGVAPLPASSGHDPPPLSRGGDRRSTARCTASSFTAASTMRRHATTSPAVSPRARQPAQRRASSSATSLATSTASCGRPRPDDLTSHRDSFRNAGPAVALRSGSLALLAFVLDVGGVDYEEPCQPAGGDL